MAALLTSHEPIHVVSTISGNQEKIQNIPEYAGQTFTPGAPVTLTTASGGSYVQVWSGTPSYGPPGNLLGFSSLAGANLGSNGQGVSPVFGSIGFPGGAGATQNVPNQPNAYNIYHGAPFVNGLTNVLLATQDSIFEGQVDASSGSTYAATTSLIGTSVGLSADSNNNWYWDLAKTTVGTNAVGVIVGLNPQDFVVGSTTTQVNNGRIYVVVAAAIIQVTQ